MSVSRLGSVATFALLLPGFTIAHAQSAATPETLTVAQCVAVARRQASAVRAAGLDASAAVSDRAAARMNRRPAYFVSAGAWVAPDGAYDPAVTNLGEYHAQLGMELPLADGGARSRARLRADVAARGAEARRVLATRDAGERAATLALEVSRLDEVGLLMREHEAGLADIGALVRSAVRSGARSPADSLRLALAEEDAALDREAHDERSRTARLELLEALARPLEGTIAVRPEPSRAPETPAGADSLALLASAERRPELAVARADEATAGLAAEDAMRSGAPAGDLSLDAGLAGTDLTHAVPASLLADQPNAGFGDRLRRDLGASAALNLRLPVFDAARNATRRARRLDHDAAVVRREAEEAAGKRDALALLERGRSAAKRVGIAENVVTRAESHFLRTKSLYAAGATTMLDLLDASDLYHSARVRRAETREEYRMIRFEIEDRR